MCTERRAPIRRVLATVLVVAVSLCAACNGTTSYLDASGTAGHDEAVLGWWLTGVSCVVVAFVCVAVLAGIWRHRRANDEPESGGPARRREIRSGLNWIYVGIAATIVILLITFAGTMVTLDAASRPSKVPSLTLDVTAHQWWWEIRYSDAKHPDLGFVTANEIHLPVGQPVRVRLQTADVIHSFWLPQLAGKTDVIPGQINEMWLEARKPGSSRGMCGEYCGLEHAVMSIGVTAESPDAFNRWAAERRAESSPPRSAEARVGAAVFTRSCGACHSVGGTSALGRVGPDLTHLASRPWIGAGALANTAANLARWIRNAPRVKEGARMPPIPLDSTELRSVVAYLQTLR